MWDVSVGGHFTAGEGSLETAVKETSEELGLSCDEGSLRFVCTVATTAEGDTPLHGSFVCNEYKVGRRDPPRDKGQTCDSTRVHVCVYFEGCSGQHSRLLVRCSENGFWWGHALGLWDGSAQKNGRASRNFGARGT